LLFVAVVLTVVSLIGQGLDFVANPEWMGIITFVLAIQLCPAVHRLSTTLLAPDGVRDRWVSWYTASSGVGSLGLGALLVYLTFLMQGRLGELGSSCHYLLAICVLSALSVMAIVVYLAKNIGVLRGLTLNKKRKKELRQCHQHLALIQPRTLLSCSTSFPESSTFILFNPKFITTRSSLCPNTSSF